MNELITINNTEVEVKEYEGGKSCNCLGYSKSTW